MGFLKCLLCNFLLFALLNNAAVFSNKTDSEIVEYCLEQYIDHFNIFDHRRYCQTFYLEDKYFKPDGPIIIDIYGQAPIEWEKLNKGQAVVLASRLNGIVYLLEHRYYGSSNLFNGTLSLQEWQYLTVEQALGDVAYFIESVKRSSAEFKNSKVIVLGCSYAGALATWARYKFPHLVDAAWASSATIRGVLDYHEYFEVTQEMYSNESSKCLEIIQKGYNEIIELLATSEGELKIRAMLEGWECGNVTQMSTFTIASHVRHVIANQNGAPGQSVKSCKFLESKNSTTEYFEQIIALVRNLASDDCYQETPSDASAWQYQWCTQVGSSTTINSNKQPFTLSDSVISKNLENCVGEFGKNFNIKLLKRGLNNINRYYGSTNLQATRVLTIFGTHDPWIKAGLNKQKNKESPVIIIEGASHCADLYAEFNESEFPQLAAARQKAYKIIKKWISS